MTTSIACFSHQSHISSLTQCGSAISFAVFLPHFFYFSCSATFYSATDRCDILRDVMPTSTSRMRLLAFFGGFPSARRKKERMSEFGPLGKPFDHDYLKKMVKLARWELSNNVRFWAAAPVEAFHKMCCLWLLFQVKYTLKLHNFCNLRLSGSRRSNFQFSLSNGVSRRSN